nr:MAG TPA: hypothetical protein [Crassvirales sp.]
MYKLLNSESIKTIKNLAIISRSIVYNHHEQINLP